MKDENTKFEEKLASLPAVRPPESLRADIMAKAARHTRPRRFSQSRLALALGIFLLLAINIGFSHFQSARIDRLIGRLDTNNVVSINEVNLQVALSQQRAFINEIMHGEELR